MLGTFQRECFDSDSSEVIDRNHPTISTNWICSLSVAVPISCIDCHPSFFLNGCRLFGQSPFQHYIDDVRSLCQVVVNGGLSHPVQ